MKRFQFALVVALGLTGATALAGASATHSVLQVKHGLWMFSNSAKVSGETVFPDTIFPTTQGGDRTQRLADLRKMLSQPTSERECLTQASLEQRIFTVGKSCKLTIVSNTPRLLEVLTDCQAKIGAFTQDTRQRLVIAAPTRSTMSIHSVSMEGAKTMTVDSVETGHLVSPDCGNVHTIEQLP